MRKRIILLIMSLVMLIPSKTFASDFSTSLTGSSSINAGDTFNINLNVSGANNLMTFDTNLSYDSNKLQLVSYAGGGGFTVSVGSSIAGYGTAKSGNFTLATLTFKALAGFAPGQSTTISVGGVTAANGDAIEMNGTGASIKINVVVPKSNNNNLKDLKVNGNTISGFSAGNTNYNLASTNDSSINIVATVEDSKASVSGTGQKNLNYGNNKFEISVTAENGSVKKYYINITRNDNRSSNNNLSSLSISPAKIDFNKNKTSYTIIVKNDISSINLVAKAEDSKSSVTGTGNKSLKVYSNKFDIVVTAENGSKKVYSINVVREDEKGNKGALSTNNNLSSLSVVGYNIEFKKDNLNYSITVPNEVDSLNIDAKVEDKKSSIEIKNDQLKVGDNVITITVTSESGDSKTYKINVTRKNDSPATTIDKLGNVLDKTTASIVEVNINDDNNEINIDLIKKLKDKNISLKINKYDGEKLLYSWEVNTKDLDVSKSFDTYVKFTTDNKDKIDEITNYSDVIYLNYAYIGKMPNDTKFKVFVGDKYDDGVKLNLYSYQDNALKDISRDLVVKNGYVEYSVSEGSEYILTRSSFDSKTNIFLIITIIELLVIIGLVIVIVYNFFKRKIKKDK